MSQEDLWNALRRDAAPRPLSFTEQHAVDRAAAVQWARELLADGRYVLLDTETTDRDPRTCALVQIGITAPDGGVLLNALVQPQAEIAPGALQVHGIGQEQLTLAATFGDLYQIVNALTKGKRVLVYNLAFDRTVLVSNLTRYGLPPLAPRSWDCLMLRWAEFKGVPNGGRNPANRTPYQWAKLPALDAGKAHGAVADCWSAGALLPIMARG